tara:strand:- start:4994 stop:5233 length:240 start_codon:yes stop_codon:yes gene_type:complete
MPKSYFHNQKINYENKNQTKINQVFNVVTKRAVDINILLNRVKIEKKNQSKQNYKFFFLTVTLLGLAGFFITFLKKMLI